MLDYILLMFDRHHIPPAIQQLIESQEPANNFLALSLLKSQQKMTFQEAFRLLKIPPAAAHTLLDYSQYQVSISTYSILFLTEHRWASSLEYPYLWIERNVWQHQQKLLPYTQTFTIDFFESENERDIYEAVIDLPNLGEGLESLFF